jgi:hypothetical protein
MARALRLRLRDRLAWASRFAWSLRGCAADHGHCDKCNRRDASDNARRPTNILHLNLLRSSSLQRRKRSLSFGSKEIFDDAP